MSKAPLYIGLMSGTSMDGVDGVLANFSTASRPRVLAHAFAPMPAELASELLGLNSPGNNELHRAALAANALVRLYVQVVKELLEMSQLSAQAITAIGAHGQTVRHQPQLHDGTGYTLQLNNPALLAELTGVDVVADFRSRDVAAGGQGAPLVPAFHQGLFGHSDRTVAVLNIGGISNLSVLGPDGRVQGWDCGPGNALMDYWCLQHTGQPFDRNGAWAASGNVIPELLTHLLQEDYLHQTPPKSTGRDLFNPLWLQEQLNRFAQLSAVDVQATLTAFTARTCLKDVQQHATNAKQLIVCGGGALNLHLMELLQQGLTGMKVVNSEALGLPPLQVEAAAFAWLAYKFTQRETGSLPSVTGAQGARVLGALYPR